MTLILPCWYLLIRFLVIGWDRKAPPIFINVFIINFINHIYHHPNQKGREWGFEGGD
jgi:hypothetical protein